MSVGLQRAGFEVVGVDHKAQPHHRGGEFVQADAMELLKDRAFLRTFDFVHASPPCQGYSSLRHLTKGKEYPDLVAAVRFHLERVGVPWSIENVPDAPLRGFVTLLCGTMFGLQTLDGRAELRRHRLFETSFGIPLRPACQHGHAPESLSVCGTGMGAGNAGKEAEMKAKREIITVIGKKGLPGLSHERRQRQTIVVTGHSYQGADAHSRRKARGTLSITGNSPQHWTSNSPKQRKAREVIGITGTGNPTGSLNSHSPRMREIFTIADAHAAMGIDWMPMKYLSQAIPPAYAEWIGRQALAYLASL